jgi:hypothetical protein
LQFSGNLSIFNPCMPSFSSPLRKLPALFGLCLLLQSVAFGPSHAFHGAQGVRACKRITFPFGLGLLGQPFVAPPRSTTSTLSSSRLGLTQNPLRPNGKVILLQALKAEQGQQKGTPASEECRCDLCLAFRALDTSSVAKPPVFRLVEAAFSPVPIYSARYFSRPALFSLARGPPVAAYLA